MHGSVMIWITGESRIFIQNTTINRHDNRFFIMILMI
jgi:hypothetical protein